MTDSWREPDQNQPVKGMDTFVKVYLVILLAAIVGVAILAAGFYYQSWWGLLGLVPLGTSLLKWCPVYVPFKISTMGKSEG